MGRAYIRRLKLMNDRRIASIMLVFRQCPCFEFRMKLIVACGGTGGHMFPGIAAAHALKERGHEVTLYLGARDVEQFAARDWDGAIMRIQAEGFASGLSFQTLRTVYRLCHAVRTCRKAMATWRPDALLAMGSYASVGPVLAAKRLNIPVALHEANAVPGRAVSFLARYAQVVALTFGEAAKRLPGRRTVIAGLPMRQTLMANTAPPPTLDNTDPPLRNGVFTVLIMGGSQGAHRLNEMASEALIQLHADGVPVQAIHLTGRKDEDFVRTRYRQAGVPARVFGFLNEMGWAYRRANWAVARAGAATCMELALLGLPALLVPLPSAARDHQTANARAMTARGAADMKAEHETSPAWLARYWADCRANPERAQSMRLALSELRIEDAAERLADLTEALVHPPQAAFGRGQNNQSSVIRSASAGIQPRLFKR